MRKSIGILLKSVFVIMLACCFLTSCMTVAHVSYKKQNNSAKEYAPGQQKKKNKSKTAKPFAPGHQSCLLEYTALSARQSS